MQKDIQKIVVIGSESTGKSTLSAALAQELHTVWVPEYARAYLEDLERPYEEPDMLAIANGQIQSEDSLASQANKLLICDTDLYVLKVWSEDKYNRVHPWIMEQIASRKYDMYLLTDIDIEWQDDPLREHAAPAARNYFYSLYRDIVINSGKPWSLISGTHEQRLHLALQAIHTLQA